MITDVRVDGLKGLPSCEIYELGRINVICGKNNSGKSTVLEALSRQGSCHPGYRISEEGKEKLLSAAVAFYSHKESRYQAIVRKVATGVLQSRPVWFKNQVNDFTAEYIKAFRENQFLRQYSFAAEPVAAVLGEQIPKYPEVVLIPPLRQPEVALSINTGAGVDPSGNGLLNYLFYAKSQYGGTDRDTYDRIEAAFRRVTSDYRFQIAPDTSTRLALSFSRGDQVARPAADCGRGLLDVLLLLHFAVHASHPLVLIEEPESHVHPDMQRRLLSFLREQEGKQFFISTHSNVFLDSAFVDRVLFTTYTDKVELDDATGRARILSDLGYSVTDNLVSDLVILVEGPTDTPVIEEFLIKLGLWERFAVKTWPLGGDIMAQLDLSVFAERYRMIALIDHDPGSDRVRKKFKERCEQHAIPVVRLERRSIENYFTAAALQEVFGKEKIPDSLSLDPSQDVVDQVGFSVKGNNRAIARAMSVKDIEGTDLMKFFERVSQLLQG